MSHQDIVEHLCLLYPLQVIHEITTQDIITVIVMSIGIEN